MDFTELAFRRVDDRWIKADDYVDWANELLECGCDASSIWELAACRWDAYVDPDQVERLFLSSVIELGFELPNDWYAALCAYSSSLCEKMLSGVTQPWDCLSEMLALAEDHNEPYIHWIWIDLSSDLEPIERRGQGYVRFNDALDLKNPDGCIRKVAQQFISLCAMPHPEKFPWVWICQECDAISDKSTFTEISACTCQVCGAISGMRNLRYFEHREEFVKRCAMQ
ncbi:hypothetical protein G3257_03925 [Janthinobacterium lividum]|uniref:hypothetical protein n=1 Tax=Janthinobacterium lividum TaxID=29581 RepID=UPI00159560B8|nr:hypothetical protein [Janthinobacterium lividum]QKY01496.1 hypothetical protein G3257_03925 [Janthinobacterium lividum]